MIKHTSILKHRNTNLLPTKEPESSMPSAVQICGTLYHLNKAAQAKFVLKPNNQFGIFFLKKKPTDNASSRDLTVPS